MGRVKSRKRTGLLVALLVIAVATAAGAVGYAVRTADRGLPGTSVAGQSINGMSAEAVHEMVEQRAEELAVVLTMDGQDRRASLSELGISVDAQATTEEAFEANGSVAARFAAIVRKRDVPAVITVDEGVQQAFLEELAAQHGATAKDASVTFSAPDAAFVVSPGEKGRGYDMSAVTELAAEAGRSLSERSLAMELTETDPAVTTEQAQSTAEAANTLIAPEVQVTGTDGVVIAATMADKASWVVLTGQDGHLAASPGLDEDSVSAWVGGAAASTNVEPVNGTRLVSSSGEVLRVTVEGTDGLSVNNVDEITRQLLDTLTAGRPYSGTFTYDSVEAQNDDTVVADGAENLAHPAAPGEHWLDINLSNNTVTAYIGADPQATMLMVPGRPGMETVTGTFQVYLKYQSQTMTGTNDDGTTWTAPNVQWVSYFYGSYALHAAPWQPSFGWSGPGGSHGCVNMSTADAQYVYDFAPVGTTVVSHY
ncbi:L,D-transpeptidase family protein [Propionibacterium australiense]|uniref:L,D-transpeptidase catalytic domain n=1 Tax=Propionibacterium australiense TaxID=119981 RepID=A0A383S4T8_9ACTN|nr:L,D-transpeptidase family protein [Propionibacterium australiense]RLP11572.1 hypothetical protein D9T14_02890 [Propionibacterium australiense]RLP12694.1 hypothetical protein D7U36_01515 [Propionibacterium australiense]SYZ32286.1 L,D-transpeptidase catalytic domain [Propionibacterium australiense]VEH90513.1 Uncharacterized vancomycin resistance protein [Propionibacterium australiense]